ncbi:MAG: Initiation factor 2B-like protein [Pycnora praestabilis]|nr:MAG: Initiation factor 2B-like protein [Pycnora praestabilis]
MQVLRRNITGLKQRSVVSSFICTPRQSPDGFKVAIFKRSDQVRVYKNKWAACSGSIDTTDADPLAAAWREVQEETSLTPADLSLLRAGKSYSIIDEELATDWTIYPFAFTLKPGAKEIVLDWEHTEYKFIPPADIEKYDTVAHLPKSLGQALEGADGELALGGS